MQYIACQRGERRCGNAEPYTKTYASEDDAGARSARVSYQPVVAKSLNTSYSYAVDMFSKRGSIILLAVLLALVVLPGVQAQTFLDDVFGSLFKGFGVAGFYDRNHSIIDFILLAIIFIGLSSMTLGKRFEGR